MSASERRSRLVWLVAGRAAISTLLLGSGVLIQPELARRAAGQRVLLPDRPHLLLHRRCTRSPCPGPTAGPGRPTCSWSSTRSSSRRSSSSPAGSPATSRCSTCCRSSRPASLLRRRGALTVAILSALLYAGLVLAAVPGALPRRASRGSSCRPRCRPRGWRSTWSASTSWPSWPSASLAGSLAERLRRAGARLESASTEIANLQAFNQDVIDSLTERPAHDRRQRPDPVVQPRRRDHHRPHGRRGDRPRRWRGPAAARRRCAG